MALDQRLKANENLIKGELIFLDGNMVGDSNCKRMSG
jgi:hypothetical protein